MVDNKLAKLMFRSSILPGRQNIGIYGICRKQTGARIMKCLKISIGNTTPTDDRTLEEFAVSDKARTPFGQLVITLAQRHVLTDYTFRANVRDDDQSLLINHEIHFPYLGESCVFRAEDQKEVSLRAVEDALRTHLRKMQEDLRPGVLRLQKDIRDIGEAAEQIVVMRARTAT